MGSVLRSAGSYKKGEARHKRENVLGYPPPRASRERLQRAYQRLPLCRGALDTSLGRLHIEDRNPSTAASLLGPFPRLGVYRVLGASFKATNCLESLNALIEERCAKVDAWKNSNQRWISALAISLSETRSPCWFSV
jgi:hypothetical protein